MTNNKSILIVDDHAAIRIGLSAVISHMNELEIVAEVDSGEAAYEAYTQLLPDIVIIDISMPGIGGIETIRRICSRGKNPYIIVYTMHEETIHARKAVEAGAMAYILKSNKFNELETALQKAITQKMYLSEKIAQQLALNSVNSDIPLVEKLSTREYEVLYFLAKGMKVNEIAKLLAISHKTVATYQTQLKHKLNINNAIDLALVAIKAGLIEEP